ncbi:phage tail tip lysozyme [Glacieibacterium sp.]|uniref:phage tail tip lysozyme n=1 Tax=Glacieibacterium sp. TaxID=2860237 RepID=UPI003B00B980
MTAVSAVQNQTQAAPSDGGRGYIVKPGDTLSGIAASHGVSLAALEKANPNILHPDLIRPGQHVSIPSGDGGAPASYTVQRGDTLSGIAARYGLDTNALARSNHLANPNLIVTGQTLRLDGKASVSGGGGTAPTTPGPGAGSSNAAAVAEKYLGQNASSLKVNRNDNLPMDPNVPSDVCCANFVSAVLTEAGQLPANLHTDSVATLNTTLRNQGWTPVSASNARPGDVVIIQSHGISHTVMVSGPGQYIGSNNRNADGSQQISHGNLSWAVDNGGVILRAPASVTAPAAGTPSTGGTAPVGPAAAGHQGRIDQAVSYFQGQGWSRNQAIGIVANLDAESNMEAGIRQHGGGPGYGLAQWEGPRQAAFAAWAGHSIQGSTFSEQLGFIQHELTTSEAGAGRALRGATGAGEAASIVTRLYERPADTAGEASRRADRAEAIARR